MNSIEEIKACHHCGTTFTQGDLIRANFVRKKFCDDKCRHASHTAAIAARRAERRARIERKDIATINACLPQVSTLSALCKITRIGEGRITRLAKKHGIKLPKAAQGWVARGTARTETGQAQSTMSALAAATWLGKFYRPVVRADVVDQPYREPKGSAAVYIVGNQRMPVRDMLALAREHGF